MNKLTQNTLLSSNNDEWETPQSLFNILNQKYKFTLDPCATHYNYKCKKYYTKEQNGLNQSWKDEIVFVNPPYSHIKEWVKKSCEESEKHKIIVILLIPARTDTIYWHEYIMKEAKKIYFIKGRLKFNNSHNNAPFPSVIIEFNPDKDNNYLNVKCYSFYRR